MKPSLCISFRFIQPFPLFHGRADNGEPEWPPSPMRAFQALLNAAGLRTRGKTLPLEVRSALQVLEVLRPSIIAPRATLSTTGHRAYVPHNQTDLVTAAWNRGNVDASIASHRIEKDFRPYRIETVDEELPTVHYLYHLNAVDADPTELLSILRPYVRSVHCLGWGIDQVVADAMLVESPSMQAIGERWTPTPQGGRRLRVHRNGSLDALVRRYDKFLNRLVESDWSPVPPLSAIEQVRYRRDTDSVARPAIVFKLLDDNDDTVSYPHAKLIHLAGMVRHVAIEMMRHNPPRRLRGIQPTEWVQAYVAGHQSPEDKAADSPHSQFSYIPLPSIGHQHTDPAVRRVMIVAPLGDEAWLDHLAQYLDGQMLEPENDTRLPAGTHLQLIPDGHKDGVRDAYIRDSRTWASFTPVILPGHDDHKPDKTRKLILKALAQSGLEQPCEFEWSTFSLFPKSYDARKYVHDDNAPGGKRRVGYFRPDHLLHQTAVHLRITFQQPVPGPITVGAGRHYGLGLFAATD